MSDTHTLEVPVLDDLSYHQLMEEQSTLVHGLQSVEALPGVARAVATQALLKRQEDVRRAVQAFERVTYRNLRSFGVATA